MPDIQISCPECRATFALTETLAQPIIEATRAEYEARLEGNVAARLAQEREHIVEQERRKASDVAAAVVQSHQRALGDLRDRLAAQDKKLEEAQSAQAEALRKQRLLDEARREVDLNVERRVNDALEDVHQRAKQEAADDLRLRIRERDEQIGSLQRQIELLKQKAEKASQQLQGEVQELELEDVLRARFPVDLVEPIAKGQRGADIVQRVQSASGHKAGSILVESKRTQAWSDGWLAKARDDQRDVDADVVVLATQSPPKNFTGSFDLLDGVWVVRPNLLVPLVAVLREALLTVANLHVLNEGRQTKAELLYVYLTGPRFKGRLTGIIERIVSLQADLDRERRSMTRAWAKRELLLTATVEGLAGLHGDLQAIAGSGVAEIEALDLAQLGAPPPESSEAEAGE